MDGITVMLSEGVRLSQISEANARLYGYKEADEVTTDFVMLECSCEKLQNLAGRQVENMVLMGKTLSEIRDSRTYRSCSVMSSGIEVGFYRFEDFCKHVLNISNTQAQNAIGLYEKFTVEEKGVCLKEEYKGYSVSQLIEMTSLPERARERIKPEMTVKEIREIKKELKQPESRVPSQDPLPGQISMTEIPEKKIPTSEFSDEEVEEILRGFFHGSYGVSIREICTSEKPIWQ